MKRINSSLLIVSAVFSFFISFFPAGVDAAELLVPSQFATIQAAISSPTFTSGDSIVVAPGTYPGGITLPNNSTIIIKGTETARTFLTGNGGGPVIIASGQTNATIQNFTFINASSGIQISNNSSAIGIKNNVFLVGLGGIAITVQGSSSVSVINNTFYQNGTALHSDSVTQIINNIFANNSTDIVDPFTVSTNVANNAFPLNSTVTTSPSVTNLFVSDPGLVDPSNLDFHLKALSPCIDTGNASIGTDVIDGSQCDIGAYGGPFADPIPFPVSGLIISSPTSTSINLTWSPNNCYLVTNTITTHGGYNLYFGSASGNYNGELASGGTLTSPINVGNSTSYTLESLTSSATPPSAPDNFQSSPRDSALVLTWSAVSGATGYEVHWGISSPDENVIDTQSPVPSWELTGLTNGQHYLIAVNAYAQQQYFFNVTAYDNQTPFHEGDKLAANEKSIQIGPKQPSGLSTVIEDFPEALTAYPALPNMGGRCFIATAAYGYYSAPEVQALRVFRDRYLLASAVGRMFVEWYYRHGPAAAAFLNDHPGYKPVVRAALMPVVGAAIFMNETSPLSKTIVFLVLGAAIALGFFRKRLSGTGGLR